MPTLAYEQSRFGKVAQGIVTAANEIVADYANQGLSLTLRQLFYQFVARGLMPNTVETYSKIGDVVSRARRAGLIDWLAIEDRTRFLRSNAHWQSAADMLKGCAEQFAVDKWQGQPVRIEVWIEKDALIGVIERVCQEFDVAYFSCRGYVSDSEMWRAAMRFVKRRCQNCQITNILHLGDHDPSGLDMTRDIAARLGLFAGEGGPYPHIQRIALTRAQIQEVNPPPNPVKLTDSRSDGYQREHGDESWELDALEPAYLHALIQSHIKQFIIPKPWAAQVRAERRGRRMLEALAKGRDK